MIDRLRLLHPFQTAETKRLAMLFAIIYFAQGMFYLPDQAISIVFKDRGLKSDEIAYFFLLIGIPWFIKPVYGLISDFFPLFGWRRKGYLLLSSSTACLMAFIAGFAADHSYWVLALLYTAMGTGLAFTDVLADAMMVESGKPRGLTGAFQSVQWASVTSASILVGLVGGHFAEQRDLHAAFIVAAVFPLVILVMTASLVREPPGRADRAAIRDTWRTVRAALGQRSVWLVASFVFLFNFTPSFGPAFLFYQTDVLQFSQQYIGILDSLSAAASVVGALLYVPLSRSLPLRRVINLAIGLAVVSTLAYLLYRDRLSAMLIHVIWGCTGMVTQLALLDLAAKACPQRVEATFFALLMSVFNLGTQASMSIGAHLYTVLGEGQRAYEKLVLISTVATSLIWLLVPLVRIERIEAAARGVAQTPRAP
jgi:predicted MFS family arabinose efflux permease